MQGCPDVCPILTHHGRIGPCHTYDAWKEIWKLTHGWIWPTTWTVSNSQNAFSRKQKNNRARRKKPPMGNHLIQICATAEFCSFLFWARDSQTKKIESMPLGVMGWWTRLWIMSITPRNIDILRLWDDANSPIFGPAPDRRTGEPTDWSQYLFHCGVSKVLFFSVPRVKPILVMYTLPVTRLRIGLSQRLPRFVLGAHGEK